MGLGRSSYDEDELAETLQRLAAERCFLVDASTLIVLDKAGLLSVCMPELRCETIPEVVTEVGDELMTRADIDVRPAHPSAPTGRAFDTDSLLFYTAHAEGLAVVSEDKKLLRRCDAAGVSYYNAGMLLLLLRLRGISSFEPNTAYRKLCAVARYGPEVSKYLEALDVFLRKQGR